MVRAKGADPPSPPPYGQPDRKISVFFTTSLTICCSLLFFHAFSVMFIRCFLSFTFSSLVAIKLVNTLGWVGWERWGFSEHSAACDLFEQCQGCRGSRWNIGTRASCMIGGGREMKISWNLWLSATVHWVDFENGNFKDLCLQCLFTRNIKFDKPR